MILPLVLWAAAADAFLAPSPIRKVPSRGATEAPELDPADLSALSTAATRMQLERRFSRSVTRRRRVYLPYADAARWARGLGLSTEAEWNEWVGLGEGKNAYVPSRPADYYGGRGEWVSWAHYLVGGADADAAPAPPPEVLPQNYFADLDYAGDAVPWDLRGRPQPAVRKAWAAGAFRNCREILDCGCGAGDNANYLASRGHAVTGFDLSPSAVAAARERAAAPPFADSIADAGGSARFEVASCADLFDSPVYALAEEIGGFPVALDSALLHCFDLCRIFTSSSRCSSGDCIASMAWGVRNLIFTQALTTRCSGATSRSSPGSSGPEAGSTSAVLVMRTPTRGRTRGACPRRTCGRSSRGPPGASRALNPRGTSGRGQ